MVTLCNSSFVAYPCEGLEVLSGVMVSLLILCDGVRDRVILLCIPRLPSSSSSLLFSSLLNASFSW